MCVTFAMVYEVYNYGNISIVYYHSIICTMNHHQVTGSLMTQHGVDMKMRGTHSLLWALGLSDSEIQLLSIKTALLLALLHGRSVVTDGSG